MSRNIVDPSALISALPTYLANNTSLSSPQDALAALLHTILSVLEFRLVSVDDASAFNEYPNNVLPTSWNSNGPSHYTFKYRHSQSSLEFVLKVTKLGDRTLFHGLATGARLFPPLMRQSLHVFIQSDRTASLDIKTSDFTSASFFPYEFSSSGALVHGFISSSRLSDFISSVKLKIVAALMPGINKAGYEEPAQSSGSGDAEYDLRANPNPQYIPRADPQPARPRPERPEHGPDPLADPRFGGYHPPANNPLEIGRRDLDPFYGGGAFAPPPLFGGPSGGDGMFVGPDHPIFGARRDPHRGPGPMGPWGGDGFLPPMGAPPGARFDPIIPGSGLPGRGARGPRGNHPQRGGDPDNDEFMPPGSVCDSIPTIAEEN
jgi:proteasome inhibitor subunit 1 (PI31)